MAVLGLAGTWCLHGCGSTSTPSPPEVPAPPAPAAGPSLPAPAPAPPAAAAPVPVAAEPEEGIPVEGTVEFPDGKVPKAFLFRLRPDQGRFEARVVIGKDGRFRTRVAGRGVYRLEGLLADGILHDYLPEEVMVEEGSPLRIGLRHARRAFLVVVDERTDTPVAGARAIRMKAKIGFWAGDDYPEAGKWPVVELLGDAEGRIDLGERRGIDEYYVVAEGRAWQKIRADHAAGPDIPVRLRPGGRVLLRIPGWKDLPYANLDVEWEGEGEAWDLPEPGEGGDLRLEGLPAGMAAFTVRRGSRYGGNEVLGMATAEIRPGAEAELDLETHPSEAGEPVPVGGTVTYHAEWMPRAATVRFQGKGPKNGFVDESVHVPRGEPGKPVPFRTEGLPPGAYWVQVSPQWETEAVVPPEGATLPFEVPRPAEVRIRVVQGDAGTPLRGATLQWHSENDSRTSHYLEEARYDRERDAFVFQVPPGRISCSLGAPGRVPTRFRVPDEVLHGGSIAPGQVVEITRTLEPAGSVRLVLRSGLEHLSRSGGLWLRRVDIGRTHPSDYSWGVSFSDGVSWRDGLRPGTWVVEPSASAAPRFEVVGGGNFEVRAGETTEVMVDLVLKRE